MLSFVIRLHFRNLLLKTFHKHYGPIEKTTCVGKNMEESQVGKRIIRIFNKRVFNFGECYENYMRMTELQINFLLFLVSDDLKKRAQYLQRRNFY